MAKDERVDLREAAQVPTLQRVHEPTERRGANVPTLQPVPQPPPQAPGSGANGSTSGGSGEDNSK
jgi:hypothetical protein